MPSPSSLYVDKMTTGIGLSLASFPALSTKLCRLAGFELPALIKCMLVHTEGFWRRYAVAAEEIVAYRNYRCRNR